MKTIRIFHLKVFGVFLVVKFSIYLYRRVFIMYDHKGPENINYIKVKKSRDVLKPFFVLFLTAGRHVKLVLCHLIRTVSNMI